MRFTDIESAVIAFLGERVDAPVSLRVPSARPPAFLRAWRNGGAAANRVLDQPQITVEAWASDDETAARLANEARDALLQQYTAMPLVRRVEDVTGPYFTPDEDTETPVYRFTVQLRVRAAR